MNRYIDTHAHYDMAAFSEDRDEVFRMLFAAGIEKVICPAVRYDNISSMMDTLKEYPNIYFALGQHPKYLLKDQRNLGLCDTPKYKDLEKYLANVHGIINEAKQQLFEVSSLLNSDRVCAIGEVGLDYSYTMGIGEKALQSAVFRSYVELSLKRKRFPLILHVRNAHEDALNILRSYNTHFVGVIHCFRGDKDVVDQYTELGFRLGIGTGIFCFPSLLESVRYIALDNILLETDSPYLDIDGVTDDRNTSLSIPLIAETIAKEKGISIDQVAEATYNNALETFKI